MLDGLDGRIARALKGTSRFGAELDSLADFVDFGVAPALVLYLAGLERCKSLGWLARCVFAIACALRLARFNVMLDDPDSRRGARTSSSACRRPAGAIVGLLPVYRALALDFGASSPPHRGRGRERSMSSAIALLMASRVPHFSGKSIGRVPREYVAVGADRRRRGAAADRQFPACRRWSRFRSPISARFPSASGAISA